MTYSGATEVQNAREQLGDALAELQTSAALPEDVLDVVQHIAQAMGALFDAERADREVERQASMKNALGALSQTLALLQDVKSGHPGLDAATERTASVMSILYDVSAPSAPSEGKRGGRADDAKTRGSGGKSKRRRRTSSRPPAPAAPPDASRVEVEVNIGATTESNFYVGFSGEVSDGGVFLATYEVQPKDTLIDALVTLPGGYQFRTPGYVRFVRDAMDFGSDAEPGIGIQFDSLPEDARALILRFIKKRAPMFYDE